jgi:hypothetical protein
MWQTLCAFNSTGNKNNIFFEGRIKPFCITISGRDVIPKKNHQSRFDGFFV